MMLGILLLLVQPGGAQPVVDGEQAMLKAKSWLERIAGVKSARVVQVSKPRDAWQVNLRAQEPWQVTLSASNGKLLSLYRTTAKPGQPSQGPASGERVRRAQTVASWVEPGVKFRVFETRKDSVQLAREVEGRVFRWTAWEIADIRFGWDGSGKLSGIVNQSQISPIVATDVVIDKQQAIETAKQSVLRQKNPPKKIDKAYVQELSWLFREELGKARLAYRVELRYTNPYRAESARPMRGGGATVWVDAGTGDVVQPAATRPSRYRRG